VLAWHNDEWTFRQLLRTDAGWLLHPLSTAFKVMFAEDEQQASDLLCQVRDAPPRGG
jgi:hypothetical protein